MNLYSKETLENLRQRVDLVELISSHVPLKPAGRYYQGLCPFHEEKTPSFMVQKGDSHYRCFGCDAHGDAITFLMDYSKLSFVEAVESLADRFHVPIKREKVEGSIESFGLQKEEIKKALQLVCDFYHHYLLHTEEGHQALDYLYGRGLDLDFIRLFHVGFAPRDKGLFVRLMQKEKIADDTLERAGLIKRGGSQAQVFFSNRVMLPIQDGLGSVIGFSSRKIDEETFGPKYLNTPETALFKKSRTLYGLSFSRRQIIKKSQAIIVEGQIDALRLIQEGFDWTVAGQGTAFGMELVERLIGLGVSKVYLALDGDQAGLSAAAKIGNLFQRKGIGVFVVRLPREMDPDTFLLEEGPPAFEKLLSNAQDYIPFLLFYFSEGSDPDSPSEKNRLVQRVVSQIRSWDQPLMRYYSLRKLAKLLNLSEETFIKPKQEMMPPTIFTQGRGKVLFDREIEVDLLRWLASIKEIDSKPLRIISANVKAEFFKVAVCRHLFSLCMKRWEERKIVDFAYLDKQLESIEERQLLAKLVQKRVNLERIEEEVIGTVKKMLERYFFEEKGRILVEIQSGKYTEEEIEDLVKKCILIDRQALQALKIE